MTAMKPVLTRWRYLAGMFHGVILWSLVVSVATFVVDGRIWSAVHYDQQGRLVYDLWWGMTPEVLHGDIVAAALLLIPVGIVLQIRPPVAALATRRATLWTAAVAVLLAGAAFIYMWDRALSWMWVLLD